MVGKSYSLCLSFLLLLFLFLRAGSRVQVILRPTCPPFIFFLSISLTAPQHFLFFVSPLSLFLSSIYLPSSLTSASFQVFIHPAPSTLPPLSLILHPSPHHFSPLISPTTPPPQRTHTINCRLVKQTNRHNSPDKGIETLITSVLHEELKILQKKDVPLPVWETKQRHRQNKMPYCSFKRQNKDGKIISCGVAQGSVLGSSFLSFYVSMKFH